ncbi:MAG: 50S ribosomal protein L25 [Actinomycetia bacterium]|nr:50S ribosomal protein L25 [Actinomycetes bacterium]
MKNIALKVEKRNKKEIKNNTARKLDKADYLPAVMYGLKKEPAIIKIKRKELTTLLKGHSISSVIFDIQIDEKSKDKEAVIVKEYQRDPISRKLMHLDFLRIQMEKEIETVVPVRILNEDIAIGIKESGGVLQHGLREFRIICLPGDIPEQIDYDIRDLGMNEIVRVENIEIDEKIKILNGPSEVIVSIIPPTELKEEDLVTEEEAEEEMEEPEVIGEKKPEEEGEAETGDKAGYKQKESGKE